MDPDSDSDVKLKWANGDVSGYVKVSRLKKVVGGKHASHSHDLAPNDRSTGWYCDVCRERCARICVVFGATVDSIYADFGN